MNTFPLKFGLERRFYRIASGEGNPDGGAWQFQGYDDNGSFKYLNARLTGLHRVLCSAAEIT